MSCSCSDCSTVVTALVGATGAAGTSTGIATGGFSTSATAVAKLTTANRLDTASNAVTVAGYQWSIITIGTVATANIAIFKVTAQINATGNHIATLTALNTNSGSAVANVSAKQNCGTNERISWQFEIANVVSGDVFAVKIVTDTEAVTPVLTSGHVEVMVYE